MTITGLIGYPVAHSLSPRIHAFWRAQHGIEGEYKLFTTQPPRLRQTMFHMRKKNWRGVNITVPHKQAVMEYLDAIDVMGTRIGAVNTITHDNGKLTGTNTDAYGFITHLRASLGGDISAHTSNILLLGAGGATRAAIVALQEAGAKHITLLNRTNETAQTLAAEFGVSAAPWETRNSAIATASMLVNTTSLGMSGQPALDLDLKQLAEGAVVYDIVYAPLETGLLKYARQRGHKTVDGLGMLLYQAQRAFECWHGVLPEVTEELRTHVLSDEGQ
jgi:shikimate dehydrogenase